MVLATEEPVRFEIFLTAFCYEILHTALKLENGDIAFIIILKNKTTLFLFNL